MIAKKKNLSKTKKIKLTDKVAWLIKSSNQGTKNFGIAGKG